MLDAPAPVAPLLSPSDLFARPRAWQRLLARSYAQRLEVYVSTYWTGAVLESLSDPDTGRWFLWEDNTVTVAERDTNHGRVVFAHAADAAVLHARWPLVLVLAGDTGACFTFAPCQDDAPSPAVSAVLARLEQRR